MALLHKATISPTKLEALTAWGPHRAWWVGSTDVTILGAYRFDDPADEVGIETFLVRSGDQVVQVPVTYRGTPLEGAEEHLVTEMQHSVLGPRWVYDGLADPAYVAALTSAVLTGARQAPMHVQDGELLVEREATTFVEGSGVPGAELPAPERLANLRREEVDGCTVLTGDDLEVTVCRRVTSEPAFDVTGLHTLHGRWPDRSTPTLLAAVAGGRG